MDSFFIIRWLLFGLTALTAGCTWLLWTRTKNIGFVLGMLAIYFWTLQGAWGISATIHHGSWNHEWTYLLTKMFPVALDHDYVRTLVYYGLFIVSVFTAATIAAGMGPPPQAQHPLIIDHGRLSTYCILGGVAALLLSADILTTAIRRGTSGYLLIADGETGGLRYVFFQLVLRGTLFAACIGGPAWLSGNQGRLIRGRPLRTAGLRYAILLGSIFLLCVALGNKNALLLGLITAVTVSVTNAAKARIGRVAITALAGICMIASINLTRDRNPLEALRTLSGPDVASAFTAAFQSNEQYAAHLSMYGVLSHDVELTHGSSLLSLLASAIPRAVWPDRPDPIYNYYAHAVNVVADQGYTIHHATAWYLNFGLAGILVGGAVLGALWGWSFTKLKSPCDGGSLLRQTMNMTSFFLITGGLPRLLRGGPEDYKSFFLTSLIIPLCIIVPACRRGTVSRATESGSSLNNLNGMQPLAAPKMLPASRRRSLSNDVIKCSLTPPAAATSDHLPPVHSPSAPPAKTSAQ